MKIKNMIIILLLIFSFMSSSTLVFSTDNENYQMDGNILTFHGVKFNIPDGYEKTTTNKDIEENNKINDVNPELNSTTDTITFENDKKDMIIISTSTSENMVYTEGIGTVVDEKGNNISVKKSINGVEGQYDNSQGGIIFSFLCNKTLVTVNTFNDDTLNQVIIKN